MQVRRRLDLYRDRVDIEAVWMLGKRFTMTVALVRLTGQTREMWIRQRMFKRSLAVAALAVATAVVIGRYDRTPTVQAVVWISIGIGILAGMTSVRSFPKVLFLRFATRDGAPGLDIARSGPDARRFDEFVDRLRRQIRKSTPS